MWAPYCPGPENGGAGRDFKLTWTYACQVLCDPRSSSRFSREEVLGKSWRYICEILFCERDDQRNPIIPASQKPRVRSNEEVLRQMYWEQGYPAHRIEAKVQAILEQRRQAQAWAEQYQRHPAVNHGWRTT